MHGQKIHSYYAHISYNGSGRISLSKSVWIVPSPIHTKLFFLVNNGECPELVRKKGKKREKIIAMVARKEYG